MKKQHEIEKTLEMMKKRQEWLMQQPTRKEMREQKSFNTIIGKTLDKAGDTLENFSTEKLLLNSKILGTVHRFFYPDTWEVIEVPVEEEPEVGSYTTEDNIIHVQFGKKEQ